MCSACMYAHMYLCVHICAHVHVWDWHWLSSSIAARFLKTYVSVCMRLCMHASEHEQRGRKRHPKSSSITPHMFLWDRVSSWTWGLCFIRQTGSQEAVVIVLSQSWSLGTHRVSSVLCEYWDLNSILSSILFSKCSEVLNHLFSPFTLLFETGFLTRSLPID